MEEQDIIGLPENPVDYNDDNIRTLSGTEHIRLRPGMYIFYINVNGKVYSDKVTL